ncbi:hypothetical protein B0T17DRAFT_512525 [Bombardia bombarda]|uniref:Luciferase domain-containing protein n=1 Tax=Bombardia bombarda TaxID=252184 RepID=A0AA39U2M2_9PEZI|nr:hypothetical protein B0T17DRAFT_512525 [Bombardia bombarda]
MAPPPYQPLPLRLPKRKGPLPVVRGDKFTREKGLPSQMAYSFRMQLEAMLEKSWIANSQDLVIKQSLIFKGQRALFCDGRRSRFNHEIATVNIYDSSVIVMLEPTHFDAVAAARWGLLHPLNSNDHPAEAAAAPPGRLPSPVMVLTYAPRHEHDVEVMCTIIFAAVGFALRLKTEHIRPQAAAAGAMEILDRDWNVEM